MLFLRNRISGSTIWPTGGLLTIIGLTQQYLLYLRSWGETLPSPLPYYSKCVHNCLFCFKRAKEKVLLVFDGVDTVSSIWLNRVKVGSTDNMFRRYVSFPRWKQLFFFFVVFVLFILHTLLFCRIFQLENCWRMGKMSWAFVSCLRLFMHLRGIKLILLIEFLLSVLQMYRRGNVTSILLEKWVCLIKQYFLRGKESRLWCV